MFSYSVDITGLAFKIWITFY